MASHMQQLCIATSPPNLLPSYCLTPSCDAREIDGSRLLEDIQHPSDSSSTLQWTQPVCSFTPQQQGDLFCAPSSVGSLQFEFTHHLDGRAVFHTSQTGPGSEVVAPLLSNRPMVDVGVALLKQEEDSYSEEEEEEEDEAGGVKVEDVSEDSSDDNNSRSVSSFSYPHSHSLLISFTYTQLYSCLDSS